MSQEYEQRHTIYRPADEVFDWLARVENLPHYLPPVKEAWLEGPAAGDKPGQRVKMSVEIPGRYKTEGEGYFDADETSNTLRWGAEFSRDYSGWLTVEESASEECVVTAHLSFGPRSVEDEVQQESSQDRDPMAEGVSNTLESIRRQLEEGTGKTSASGV